MKNNMLPVITALILTLSSCAEDSSLKSTSVLESNAEPSMSYEVEEQTKSKAQLDLKIIKTANCRFEVDDLSSSFDKLSATVSSSGGYISSLEYKQDSHRNTNSIQIRIPNEKFDNTLNEIIKLATFVDFKNIQAVDVSADYIDLQARLQTKIAVKKRYDEILRSTAKTVDEVLKTEEKLRVLQEEIESAQSRLAYMAKQVSLSTIDLQLYQTVEFKEKPAEFSKSFADDAVKAFSNGWSFVKGFILVLFNFWPLIPFAFLGWIFYKRFK